MSRLEVITNKTARLDGFLIRAYDAGFLRRIGRGTRSAAILTVIGLSLATGTTGLTSGLSGCVNIEARKQVLNYTKSENQVYDYVLALSREIPSEFIKRGNLYHDPSLIVGDEVKLDVAGSTVGIKSGKGRFVFRTHEGDDLDMIVVGYVNVDEYRKSRGKLKDSIGFNWTRINAEKYTGFPPEMLFLNHGRDVIIYVGEGGKWRRIFKEVGDERYSGLAFKEGELVPKEVVQRYLDLPHKLKNTYFRQN